MVTIINATTHDCNGAFWKGISEFCGFKSYFLCGTGWFCLPSAVFLEKKRAVSCRNGSLDWEQMPAFFLPLSKRKQALLGVLFTVEVE
jgi:hypothetical protein